MRKTSWTPWVGRTANLQCSLGTVSRLALYLWLWELTDALAAVIFTQRDNPKRKKKKEHVEYNYLLSASKAILSTGLICCSHERLIQ